MASPIKNNSKDQTVLIIGGGVIGLCVAYYSLLAGKKVILVEKGPKDGDNCSAENAGMVVPSHFVPLAAPGMISLGLRWMLNPESPFSIRLRPDASMLRWLYLFWKSANKKHVIKNRELIRDLNLRSRELFVDLASDGSYEITKKGLLMLCKTSKAFDEESELAAEAKELGLDVEISDPSRLAEIDPTIEMDVKGGVWFKQDCHMNPGAFLSQLKDKILNMGAEVVYNAVGQKIIFDSRRPKALECVYLDKDNNNQKIETIAADQFVICGGAWSSSLADSLGIRLPLVSGKGYSMTLNEPVQLPSICSILNEARVAVTPFNGSLRFAGTMELGDNDLSVNSRRINGILKSIPNGMFDLLISNPPYISKKEIPELMKDVIGFEPESALTDYSDGLTFYKRFSEIAPKIVHNNSLLILEVGLKEHPQKVYDIFFDQGYTSIELIKDYNGDDRVMVVQV